MPIQFELIMEQAPVSSQTGEGRDSTSGDRIWKGPPDWFGYGGTSCRSGIGHNHLLL